MLKLSQYPIITVVQTTCILERSLWFQADGREVINGSGVYKMVDPTMPPQSCFSGAASAAMARGSGGITNDLAVKEATRQTYILFLKHACSTVRQSQTG